MGYDGKKAMRFGKTAINLQQLETALRHEIPQASYN